jgi:hypothetical protein
MVSDMKRLIILASIALVLFCYPVLADEASDNVTVTVSITSATQISVLEDSLVWSTGPGTVGDEKNVHIRNTGSVNVTNIEAELNTTDIETSNPLEPPADAVDYASGGFMVLHNSSESTYYYVGRLEWNATSQPAGITNDQTGSVSWGFHKNVTNNYLWSLANGTAAGCNDTGSNLRIKEDADTGDNRDMQSGEFNIEGLSEGSVWATGSFSGGPLQGQCVALHQDCTKFYIYKYDFSSKFPSCGNATYLQTANFTPESLHIAKARVFVPSGVPEGSTSNTVLTIIATSA